MLSPLVVNPHQRGGCSNGPDVKVVKAGLCDRSVVNEVQDGYNTIPLISDTLRCRIQKAKEVLFSSNLRL